MRYILFNCCNKFIQSSAKRTFRLSCTYTVITQSFHSKSFSPSAIWQEHKTLITICVAFYTRIVALTATRANCKWQLATGNSSDHNTDNSHAHSSADTNLAQWVKEWRQRGDLWKGSDSSPNVIKYFTISVTKTKGN